MNRLLEVDQRQLVVFQDGFGKAGMDLHGKVWDNIDQEVTRIIHDTDPRKRELARSLGLMVVDSLEALPGALPNGELHVVDNTTSTESRVSSVNDVRNVLNYGGITPRAWLLEKPVFTPGQDRETLDSFLDEVGQRVFVNENYLASEAVSRGSQLVQEKQAAGVGVNEIDVHFVKDRVPNVVLDGRFTDAKGLAVYGIEMPHQLAIASALLGTELKTGSENSVVQNDFFNGIDRIAESQGNLTVFEQDGTKVTLRQGLGPYDFGNNNELVRREYNWKVNEAERYARVAFADGTSLLLTLDPVKGEKRYHSKYELFDTEGQTVHSEVFEDNTLKNLIGAVATFAASDGEIRPALLDNLGPKDAIRYAEQLGELRANAGTPVAVGSLGTPEFTERYLQSLREEQQKRQQS